MKGILSSYGLSEMVASSTFWVLLVISVSVFQSFLIQQIKIAWKATMSSYTLGEIMSRRLPVILMLALLFGCILLASMGVMSPPRHLAREHQTRFVVPTQIEVAGDINQ